LDQPKPSLIAHAKVLAIIVLGLAAEAFNVYQPYENSLVNQDASAYGIGGFSVSSKPRYTVLCLARLTVSSSQDAVRGCMLIAIATLTYN